MYGLAVMLSITRLVTMSLINKIIFGQNSANPATVERFSVRNSFFFRSLFLLSTCADTAAAVVVWL